MTIDDDAIDNYLLKVLIENNTIAEAILEFDNAENALDYIEKHQLNNDELPDLILLDIHMPRMDGLEFMTKLDNLNIQNKEKCKICIVSGSIVDKDIMQSKLNNHVCSFTSKPITLEFLLSL